MLPNPLIHTDETFGLSPMQQGMLLDHLARREPGANLEQIVFTLEEALDVRAFEAAWQDVLARHAAMRTSFAWDGLDAPRQRVHAGSPLSLACTVTDLASCAPRLRRRVVDEYLDSDRARPFDITRPPLMRVTVFRTGERAQTVVWTFPHLLMDGRSFPLVLRDLFQAYDARRGAGERLGPAPPPYRRFIEWLEHRDRSADEAFWRSRLAGLGTPTMLAGTPRGFSSSPGRGELELRLSRELTGALHGLADREQVTLNALVQGAWAVLASHYTGEGDVVFGGTRSARSGTIPGAESIVGVFVNTLPVRVTIDGRSSVASWLRDLRRREREVKPYEHATLADVQAWADAGPARTLFDSIVVFDHALLDSTMRVPGGPWATRAFRLVERTGYPFTLYGYAEPELLLKIAYDRPVLSEDGGRRLLGHLATVLEGMVLDPDRPVRALPILTAAERRQLQGSGNGPAAPWPANRAAHQLVQAQAARTPDATALICGGDVLTYRELDTRADRLASRLRQLGAGPDSLVGIALERSADLVVSVLAVWKAGAAYLPLDPAYPAARLSFMLEDADVGILLTTRSLLDRLPRSRAGTLCVDDAEAIGDAAIPARAPVSAASLAYVIYTSGSTGRPKGVMIEHRNLVSFFAAMDQVVPCERAGCWLAVSSLSFDISILELFWPLTRGFRVVVHASDLDDEGAHGDRGLAGLPALIRRHGVTHLQCTPSLASLLAAAPEARQALAGLRALLLGGEPLPAPLAGDLAGLVRGDVLNMYGPTETTIWSTTQRIPPDPARVAIGRPIPNTSVHVLGPDLTPVPIGVTGELFIGGPGVARGYLKRPELTAERFIPDPIRTDGSRLYRTGDLVSWREDGVLEFVGRKDSQVKVRGHRVELGEIEATLLRHPGVRDAVVVAREDSPADRRLIAYVVANGTPLAALRSHAIAELPAPLVPSAIVPLVRMPLLPNGKTDRSALPLPGAADVGAGASWVPPATALEREIAQVWREVLGIERVSVEDNFFDIGGHSLLSLRVYGRLRRIAGRALALTDLFRYPTVRALARHLAAESDTAGILRPSRARAEARRAAGARLLRDDRRGGGTSL